MIVSNAKRRLVIDMEKVFPAFKLGFQKSICFGDQTWLLLIYILQHRIFFLLGYFTIYPFFSYREQLKLTGLRESKW